MMPALVAYAAPRSTVGTWARLALHVTDHWRAVGSNASILCSMPRESFRRVSLASLWYSMYVNHQQFLTPPSFQAAGVRTAPAGTLSELERRRLNVEETPPPYRAASSTENDLRKSGMTTVARGLISGRIG